MLSSLYYSARNLKYQVSLPEVRIHAWGECPLLMPRTRPIWDSGRPTGEAQPTGTCMQSLSTQLASSERSPSYCALYYLLLPNLLTLRLPVGPAPYLSLKAPNLPSPGHAICTPKRPQFLLLRPLNQGSRSLIRLLCQFAFLLFTYSAAAVGHPAGSRVVPERQKRKTSLVFIHAC